MLLTSGGFDFVDHTGATILYLTNSAQSTIDLTGTKSRTGIGCCIINSGFAGPTLAVPSHPTSFYWGGAFMDVPGADPLVAGCFSFQDVGTIDQQILIKVEADGNISAYRGNSGVTVLLGTSTTPCITASAYHYIEIFLTISTTVGVVRIWVDNVLALELTGVNTQKSIHSYISGVQFVGGGGAHSDRHDDYYLNDLTGADNNSRRGPYRSFSFQADADGNPIGWTPSTPGFNYLMTVGIPQQLVNNVNSGGAVGNADGYHYPVANVSGQRIFAATHSLLASLDSGAATLRSAINGNPGTTTLNLTTDPQYLQQIYERDPGNVLWTQGAFGTNFFGPRQQS